MNYSEQDRTLNALALDCKYNPEGGGQHPYHTRADWRWAVGNEDTIIGYWDWVEYQIDMDVANEDETT